VVRHLHAAECERFTQKLGGLKETIKTLATPCCRGFTAPKSLWLKKHEPKITNARDGDAAARYLNSGSLAKRSWKYGDASGSALLDVRKRKWSMATIDAIDPELAGKLPRLISSDCRAGKRRRHGANALPDPDVVVSAGAGDT